MRRKTVVFVCIGNSCRSQMAEGWARHLGGDVLVAKSAGTAPAGVVDKKAVQVMREAGVDISKQWSKGLDEVDIDFADYVITMGCCAASDVCPVSYRGGTEDWNIADPVGQSLEVFRAVSDDVRRRVEELIVKIRGGAE